MLMKQHIIEPIEIGATVSVDGASHDARAYSAGSRSWAALTSYAKADKRMPFILLGLGFGASVMALVLYRRHHT